MRAAERSSPEDEDGPQQLSQRVVPDELLHHGERPGGSRRGMLGLELRPGHIFGEMGLLTSGFQRTQSVECIESGHLLTITYDEVRELYFGNPEFGFYFLRLVGERLLQNLKRAEDMLAAERQKHAVAVADPPPASDTESDKQSHGQLRPAYENLYFFARI